MWLQKVSGDTAAVRFSPTAPAPGWDNCTSNPGAERAGEAMSATVAASACTWGDVPERSFCSPLWLWILLFQQGSNSRVTQMWRPSFAPPVVPGLYQDTTDHLSLRKRCYVHLMAQAEAHSRDRVLVPHYKCFVPRTVPFMADKEVHSINKKMGHLATLPVTLAMPSSCGLWSACLVMEKKNSGLQDHELHRPLPGVLLSPASFLGICYNWYCVLSYSWN